MANRIIIRGGVSNEDINHIISSDEEMVAFYDQLIKEVGSTGHAYSIKDARSYSQSDLPALERLRDKYLAKVAEKNTDPSGRNKIDWGIK